MRRADRDSGAGPIDTSTPAVTGVELGRDPAMLSGSVTTHPQKFRARQRLGKYRIERKISEGPYATIYSAADTIEGQKVALKIPNDPNPRSEFMQDFRREVRLAAQLDHPNILPLKDANIIAGHFVIVTPLGNETLEERLTRRLSVATMMDYASQLLEAVAYAHELNVLHCDIKPDNIFLFDDNRLRLGDFGLAKTVLRTVKASGSGTLGFVAPEQAMGRPSFRSDVFATGLVLYRMFAGELPEWPFKWPPRGIDKLRSRAHPDLVRLIRKSIELSPAKRFRNAVPMADAFEKIKRRWALQGRRPKKKTNGNGRHWRQVQFAQFQKQHGKSLEMRHRCGGCRGPVSEAMIACPWCGKARKKHAGETTYPAHCPSCNRGVKLDWEYCPWCYGPGFEPATTRRYSDKRYTTHCKSCRGRLMPFMRYCPWCHTRTSKPWNLAGTRERCPKCRWGVASEFWDHCPWCASSLKTKRRKE